MADVKKFKTPKRRLVFEKHSLVDTKQRYKKQITEHYFNHSVSLLVPGSSVGTANQFFQDHVPCLDEFCVSVLPLHVFIEKEFIEEFIKQGNFYALSRKTKIDTENCVAVLPTENGEHRMLSVNDPNSSGTISPVSGFTEKFGSSDAILYSIRVQTRKDTSIKGVLLLSLDKDTYEELGLVGKQSLFQNKLRFNVEIDLKSSSFHPGKNLYERVRWCLKDHLDLEFEFVLTWTDTDNRSDIKKLQSYFTSYKCNPVKNKEDTQSMSNARIPVINSQETKLKDNDNNNLTCVCADSFYGWLGSVHCNIDCSSGSPDSYVSTFTCPSPSTVSKEMAKYQWTGFITPQRIINLLEASRSFLQSSHSQKPPWIALNVWGFADTPVSWIKNEHGFHYEGDNMYTIVIFPSDVYWCYMALGSNDVCS